MKARAERLKAQRDALLKKKTEERAQENEEYNKPGGEGDERQKKINEGLKNLNLDKKEEDE